MLGYLRQGGTYLPTGCQEKVGGGGCGQSLVGMATGGSCCSHWCWRSGRSVIHLSPGGEETENTETNEGKEAEQQRKE